MIRVGRKRLLSVARIGAILVPGLLVAGIIGGGIWYASDRTGMLERLCEAGLPNFSRPSVVRADDLGCAILGPRRRVSGVLLTAFEVSNFAPDNLGPPPTGGGFTGGTWHTPNQTAPRNPALDHQLETKIPGLCGIGLAQITAEGWVTETPGNFGHLGIYAREFYEDRVVSVGPPPARVVENMRKRWATVGIGDCH